VSDIEQIDKIIGYDRRIRSAEVSGLSHASYILEDPERTDAKIKELNDLRYIISADDLDKSYKERFFQSIDNSLSYFNHRKKEKTPEPLLMLGIGIFLGVAGMKIFEDAMKGFGENLSQAFERKVYEKMDVGEKEFKPFINNYLSGVCHGKE